jgi:predicted transposase/invertase (TIGR01784 family)
MKSGLPGVGEAVMVPGIDPKVDIVFKRLFGTEANADLLIDPLNAVLAFPPGREVTAVEILKPFNEQETLDDKLSILDIKARDAAGRQFNVEMQVEPYHAYPARVVYYLTKLHQQQLHAGEEYATLAASYSISFLDHVLYSGTPRWYWRFQLRDLEEPALVFSDQLTVVVIELTKFRRGVRELRSGLECWCYFLRHGEELDTEKLPEPLQVPPMPKAMEVLRMVTQSDLERERYESRLKFQRDMNARMREAQEGGVLIGRVQAYEHFLKVGPTPVETLREMSLEQLSALADRLGSTLVPARPG